jgi:hypothetical protein
VPFDPVTTVTFSTTQISTLNQYPCSIVLEIQSGTNGGAASQGENTMLDGTFANDTDDSHALVPVSLAAARSALARHPLAPCSTALVRVEESPPDYAEQLAATDLGYNTDAGRRLWTVSKAPLYGSDGRVWPDAFGTTRDDTGARLGIVGPRYKPLQNAQLGEALDLCFRHIPAAFRPRIVNAGALAGGVGFGAGPDSTKGARVFAQLALPAALSDLLRVDADKHSPTAAFLTLTNTHDGTSAAVIGAAITRIVCRNTWQMAQSEAKRRNGLALRHTVGNVDAYREHVSQWLKDTAKGYAVQGERLRTYARKALSAEVVATTVNAILYPDAVEVSAPTKARKANVAAVLELIESRDGEFVPAGEVTAYSVLNAVTAYTMHSRPAKGTDDEQTDTRLWSVLTDDKTIPRAFRLLDQLAA